MTTKSTVIELNGRSYDALTGAMLGKAERPEHRVRVAAMPTKQPPRSAQSDMDGFVRHSRHTTAKQPGSAHIAAHQPQPTRTLMRRAVKSPQLNPASSMHVKQGIRTVQTSLKPHMPAKMNINPKLSSDVIDPLRSKRAAVANRSGLVKHFTTHKPNVNHLAPTVATIESRSAHRLAQTTQLLPEHPKRPTYNSNPALASAMSNTSRVAQSMQTKSAVQPSRQSRPSQSGPTTGSQDDDHDIFAQALAHATSHQELSPKESKMSSAKRSSKRHRNVLGFAAGAAAFVLMCGFVAYQNKANIQLQMASAKAGFSASVPLYKPAGYSMDKLNYSTGAVAMAFQNDSTKTGFNLTQKKSNWNSQTLLENFVATSNQPYQGYESAGRTIYVYGQGKATWVNGGIWYQIDGASNLSNDQIVKVAASM